jgi:hypothetical protein
MSTRPNKTRPTGPMASPVNGTNSVIDGRQDILTGPAAPASSGGPGTTNGYATNGYATNGYATNGRPLDRSEADDPRIVEEHRIVGADGEDEATDDRGRRWYHPRPQPRGRADIMGFNYTWWLICIIFLVFIAFFPW